MTRVAYNYAYVNYARKIIFISWDVLGPEKRAAALTLHTAVHETRHLMLRQRQLLAAELRKGHVSDLVMSTELSAIL